MSEELGKYTYSEKEEKKDNRTRPKQIVIRATEKEFNQIKKNVKKSKLTQNKFLLQSALDKEITVVEGIKDLVLETKRIVVNLNQLTKLSHEGKVNCKEELEEINGELVEVWQSLRQLIQKQV